MVADVSVLVVVGPTGLLLASELHRRGVECRIIDEHSAPLQWDRATVVKPRTLEVLSPWELSSLPEGPSEPDRIAGTAMACLPATEFPGLRPGGRRRVHHPSLPARDSLRGRRQSNTLSCTQRPRAIPRRSYLARGGCGPRLYSFPGPRNEQRYPGCIQPRLEAGARLPWTLHQRPLGQL